MSLNRIIKCYQFIIISLCIFLLCSCSLIPSSQIYSSKTTALTVDKTRVLFDDEKVKLPNLNLDFIYSIFYTIKPTGFSIVKYKYYNENSYRLKLLEYAKENKLKTAYLVVILTLFIVSAFVLLIVWKNKLKLQNLNKEILTQNISAFKSFNALKESHSDNTRIMSIIAHDLRSPMNANISIISLLLKNSDLLPKHREMMEVLRNSNLRYLQLVTDLLNIEPLAPLLVREPVGLSLLIEECVNTLRIRATEKNQQIKFYGTEVVINVNKEKIWRVISNLITNAIKFSNDNSQIDVELQKRENSVLIIVKDYGLGIPDENKDKIFQMFTSAKRTGTAGEESFGLGLYISLKIVKEHHGEMWFTSVVGQGSSFFVELPLA